MCNNEITTLITWIIFCNVSPLPEGTLGCRISYMLSKLFNSIALYLFFHFDNDSFLFTVTFFIVVSLIMFEWLIASNPLIFTHTSTSIKHLVLTLNALTSVTILLLVMFQVPNFLHLYWLLLVGDVVWKLNYTLHNNNNFILFGLSSLFTHKGVRGNHHHHHSTPLPRYRETSNVNKNIINNNNYSSTSAKRTTTGKTYTASSSSSSSSPSSSLSSSSTQNKKTTPFTFSSHKKKKKISTSSLSNNHSSSSTTPSSSFHTKDSV